ncbi:hypothetical protein [Bacillus cereus group sp. N21]|uniref:hypothetical protein n=1 Tax=Bacillus cereus group sp. N21 TaxID=2794591 RepID=UPI0018F50288|nr:hypothetical protein [Bacillus cereus group sp. N21]MBJ8030317.1 hypothetical protein [Bacillus cereus group sp. N21]
MKEYMEGEVSRGDNQVVESEVQGEFLVHIIKSTPLYDSVDLQRVTGAELSEPVVQASKFSENKEVRWEINCP